MSVTTGTGGYLITATDQVPENLEQDAICNFSSVKGQYILESSVLTCCSAFDWFRRQFYPDSSFDEINREVEQTPIGSHGCLCVPYFMGRSTPDWNNMAKAEFANVTLGTTKQDMLRSLLEFSFFPNMCATLMLVFFGTIMAILGEDFMRQIDSGFAETTAFPVYILIQSLYFTVYLQILNMGVKLFVGELTASFKGISDKLLPGAVPAVDCAVAFNYAPGEVYLKFP